VASDAPYNYFDLGQCKRGDVWRVELTRAANVFLVDPTNYSNFKNSRDFRYRGGLIQRSPHDFVIPSPGRWYIVAHLGSAKHCPDQRLPATTSASHAARSAATSHRFDHR
jgi:hypothetical protein